MLRAARDFFFVVFLVALCAGAIVLTGCQRLIELGSQLGKPAPVPAVAAAPTPALQTVVAQARAVAQPAVPREALAYRADLIRISRAAWGLEAPVATFAAQIHQESAWKPTAVSRVGAAGLAQFMPATSKWISGLYSDLKDNQPFNPAWAMRAMVTYDLWLHQRTPAGYAQRDRMWVALRSYNGGLGHWQAESRNAASQDRAAVDAACGTAKRNQVHCKENLGYPERILVALQPRYLAWGPGV